MCVTAHLRAGGGQAWALESRLQAKSWFFESHPARRLRRISSPLVLQSQFFTLLAEIIGSIQGHVVVASYGTYSRTRSYEGIQRCLRCRARSISRLCSRVWSVRRLSPKVFPRQSAIATLAIPRSLK